MYQVNDWLRVLPEVAKTVSLSFVCRDQTTAQIVAGRTDIPVFHSPDQATTETLFYKLRVGVVLYLNQYRMNFDATGYSDAFHVFVSHGESDKSYMSQNSLKIFDYFFVAGEAARGRISRALPSVPSGNIIPIGRPQLHFPPAMPSDINLNPDLPTLMYAPTWEGTSKSMAYSSVVSHGVALAKQMIEREEVNFIYRPHPFLGLHSLTHGKADKRIRQIIAKQRSQSPPHSTWVDESEFGWHLSRVDWLITDVSAVAYDWLATKRPALVCDPGNSPLPESDLFDVFPTIEPKAVNQFVTRLMHLENSRGFSVNANRVCSTFLSEPFRFEPTELVMACELKKLLAKRSALKRREPHEVPIQTRQIPRGETEDSSSPKPRVSLEFTDIVSRAKYALVFLLNFYWTIAKMWTRNTPSLIFLPTGTHALGLPEVASRIERVKTEETGGKSVTVACQELHVFAWLQTINLLSRLRRTVQVRWSPSISSIENLLGASKPERIYYLALSAENQSCLRFSGYSHLVLTDWPEEQTSNHNFQAYDNSYPVI